MRKAQPLFSLGVSCEAVFGIQFERGVVHEQDQMGRNGHPDEPKQRAGPGQEQEPEQERTPFHFMTQRPFGDGALTLVF